ncbi:hypothetical protein D1816_14190 [Aquimarina sp. AD10]|uniref:Uncharacterized protein n=1 Tax=Aquimarina aggregata TaxID=1642818 RepID=A0A162ZXF6_9FLAO|nr:MULTISPECIES: hypothetical protein [Aquimarina]AXT61451.1 hypothetical protein D1816_14190 [Aquimarina sp. AD10]KZS40111.1 hypothetical protein AWE51_25305 [Aquimarina aggregata]RKM89936.1 hypothetical protein D7033_24710 [Aquimarina sp. AD10]
MIAQKQLLLFISLAVVGIFYSCNREELEQDSGTIQKIEVNEGTLTFETQASFENTIEYLMKNQSNLDQWESQFSTFVSMRTAFENISENDIETMSKNNSNSGFENLVTFTEADGEIEARMNIDDLVLATIVNEEGLVQVGASAYKIRYNKLYKVDKSNLDILKSIDDLEMKNSLKSNNIESFSVTHNYFQFDAGELQTKADRDCTKRYWKKKRKRLKGEQWTTNIGPFYSGAGARTKHQKRSARIWWRNKTQRLRLRLNGTYTQYFNGIPSPPINVNEDSGWRTDDGREAYTFDFCVNANCSFQINSLSSIHECTCDDGNYERCDIVF